MKPQQQEIDRLREEASKLKGARDIPKKAAASAGGARYEDHFNSRRLNIWPIVWRWETLVAGCAGSPSGQSAGNLLKNAYRPIGERIEVPKPMASYRTVNLPTRPAVFSRALG